MKRQKLNFCLATAGSLDAGSLDVTGSDVAGSDVRGSVVTTSLVTTSLVTGASVSLVSESSSPKTSVAMYTRPKTATRPPTTIAAMRVVRRREAAFSCSCWRSARLAF